MRTKLRGHPKKVTNLLYHLKTGHMYKIWKKISLLCESSWPHHSVSIRKISSGTIKSNRIHQRRGSPFTSLLCDKSIFQVEIPHQKRDIAHTHWCTITVRITRYKLCMGSFLLGYQNFNYTSKYNGAIFKLSNIIKNVLSSESEAEVEALFHNVKAGQTSISTL